MRTDAGILNGIYTTSLYLSRTRQDLHPDDLRPDPHIEPGTNSGAHSEVWRRSAPGHPFIGLFLKEGNDK